MKGDPVGDHLKKSLEADRYLADLFLLLHLEETSSGLPPEGSGQSPALLVPASLDAVLSTESRQDEDLLEMMLLWARSDTKGMSGTDLSALAEAIRKRYGQLREAALLRVIEDEADLAIAEVIEAHLSAPPSSRGAFARMLQTVRESTVTLLSASKRTGMSILMRGRDFCRLVRDRITQLELPAKADALVELKAGLFRRLYAFKGVKGTKVFVGIALSVAGIWVTAPVLTGAGVVLAIVDP